MRHFLSHSIFLLLVYWLSCVHADASYYDPHTVVGNTLPDVPPHAQKMISIPNNDNTRLGGGGGLPDRMMQRGGGLVPAGYNPFGYKTTELGERFLDFGASCLDSDVGRVLASIKQQRKTISSIKTTWLEIVRVSKSAQSMRIYRTLEDLIDFCLAARLID
jgi:hypothetical protein